MTKGEQLAERIRAHIEEGRWDAMLAAAKELHAYETQQAERAKLAVPTEDDHMHAECGHWHYDTEDCPTESPCGRYECCIDD